jgi:predicted amidohydrolase
MQRLIITTIQTALNWEDKQANLEMLEQKIKAIEEKTHVVVLPEMFSTGFSVKPIALAETMEGPSVAWMKRIAKEKNIILAGSLIIQDGEDFFNRFLWVLPNGELGVYDKRHCFSLAGEDEHYTAGNKRTIASVGGWKINLQVCYDLRFPVWARQQIQQDPEKEAAPEYDVLIYVANWPEKRIHAWRTLLQARAIENQSYVVGVNRVGEDGSGLHYSGNSMVVGPLGEIIYEKANEKDTHTVILERSQLDEVRKSFPFWLDGDNFLIV